MLKWTYEQILDDLSRCKVRDEEPKLSDLVIKYGFDDNSGLMLVINKISTEPRMANYIQRIIEASEVKPLQGAERIRYIRSILKRVDPKFDGVGTDEEILSKFQRSGLSFGQYHPELQKDEKFYSNMNPPSSYQNPGCSWCNHMNFDSSYKQGDHHENCSINFIKTKRIGVFAYDMYGNLRSIDNPVPVFMNKSEPTPIIR